jgi:hypothetical protein
MTFDPFLEVNILYRTVYFLVNPGTVLWFPRQSLLKELRALGCEGGCTDMTGSANDADARA